MQALTRLRAAARAGPLADRSFRLLTGGQLTSTIGDYCYAVALPWLVLSGGGSAAVLGIVLASYGVARVAVLLAGGVLADKLGPRRVMLAADAGRAVLAGLLVLIAARHVTALAVLAPVGVVLGAGEGLFVPATLSIMPTLLAPDGLAAGNAINMAALQAGGVLGPVIGGTLVSAAGPVPAFAVDAGSFAVSAVTLALLRAARAGAAADQDEAVGETTGTVPGLWEFVRRERLIKLLLGIVLMANLGVSGTYEVAAPALAHQRWGAGGYGALLACMAVGTIGGTLAAAMGTRLRRPAVAAVLAMVVTGASDAAIPFLGGLPGACAAALVLGVTAGFGNTVFITLLQKWVPAALLGRIMSLVMICALGSFPVSAAVTGALVRSIGPQPFFPVAGAVVVVTMLGVLSQSMLRQFGARTDETAEAAAAT